MPSSCCRGVERVFFRQFLRNLLGNSSEVCQCTEKKSGEKKTAPLKAKTNQPSNIVRKAQLDPTFISHAKLANWPKSIPSPAASCRNHRSTSQPENQGSFMQVWEKYEPICEQLMFMRFFVTKSESIMLEASGPKKNLKEYRSHSQDPLHTHTQK